jgi:UDP-N-acetylglucosamine:LPS N-acetylglucosamine transferase
MTSNMPDQRAVSMLDAVGPKTLSSSRFWSRPLADLDRSPNPPDGADRLEAWSQSVYGARTPARVAPVIRRFAAAIQRAHRAVCATDVAAAVLRLVVTHGGFNTVQAALSRGLPMVILPIAADQHVNAQSCGNLGVGRVVGPEERAPQAIRAAVGEVLATQTYPVSAERVRDDMAAMPGAEYAVELLERLVADKQPLVSIALGA